ncbi:transmembrane protein 87A isoform X6 [Ostrinia furnacalis]|uniref:transmembrane protein 87A isoform X1 n=1 Tax=Ostrinia furnacalis TaxID=93504 RepID=UPI00103F5904|nr:transmembrane protein 87A isoform X1 [Ostrinia furnacalis]XP_028156931.1 transmembrane protein 87A isoform X2 [Ostrinia furnacalis]XP_028156932.1 transmembrane protein 87A isoform X3 [Ostrinia furnacalis]XP_028156933.1 transmembrane protein 87A isoform X4 [Ostrinia furnacalis]XP_028156934.1 transmembrane protein 87A isoform X5 [Ostrinia furnacalis]XP_028156935.1 transmembrane protein 87A isoform X6 [Ostrinia furnacalis]
MFRRLFILAALISVSLSFSDVGRWDLPLNGGNCGFQLAKSLFKNSKLIIVLHCGKEAANVTVSYHWSPFPCSPDYFHYFEQQIVECPRRVERSVPDTSNSSNLVQAGTGPTTYNCHNGTSYILQDEKYKLPENADKQIGGRDAKIRPLLMVDKEGVYKLEMSISSSPNFKGSMQVEMLAPSGYLSAAMWPLLVFFGVMCGVYTVLCAGWLLVCGLQWRDLLRIQYWIGGVALLGMVESATYYGVYSAINNSGYFSLEAYLFAEWVSVAKRALARMLVIIVSLGFGIVKPRLGPALQRVVGAGLLWFALAALNAWLRLHHRAGDRNRALLLSEAPLSLLDSAVCWWVFVSLAHTMRTLQLRRNTIKLSLYRHFTNTLIFAVISSVVFMLYSIKSYRVLDCIREWKEVWMDEAYWHILFASVLTVIMVLWRPTNNNQRYAFTPLLDNAEDDEDEEEQFVNDAYGVKMRGPGINNSDNTEERKDSSHPDPSSNSLDSDLRWVEENIPTSTLPLLDSDEEIINTKFEVSKMQ